jgi:hypothetical protein
LTGPWRFAGINAEIKKRQIPRPRRLHEERLRLMNKRDAMLSLIQNKASAEYIPAAFFA